MNNIAIVFFSGLSIGIVGSFHCIGMCGPLALAIPVNHLAPFRRYLSIFLYNLGRAVSYTSMGVIIGLIGHGMVLYNLQQWLSIGAGIFILLILIIKQFASPVSGKLSGISEVVKNKLGSYLKSDKKLTGYLNIGILNGFLPCGLVYIAIAASVAAGSVSKSIIVMLGFGLGTLPIMALTMIFGKFIPNNVRQKLNKITPFIIICLAVLLILRGLNLGIPYISPKHNAGHIECCHP